ncbi:phosphoserine phosphatase [Pelomyxa schiedti]|nr:phosphoserine phosphatase [Pelomyxa schiedti]
MSSSSRKIKLAVFDLDGTLSAERNSIWKRLHIRLGCEAQAAHNAERFFAGEIGYEEWAKADTILWKGTPLSVVLEEARATEIAAGAVELLDALHRHGIATAILSAGLDVLANHFASILGIKHVAVNELVCENGAVTGDVKVIVPWDKTIKLREIAQGLGVDLEDVAFIGDGPNDIAAFGIVGLPIAVNVMSESVSAAARHTITGDLRQVLPLLTE